MAAGLPPPPAQVSGGRGGTGGAAVALVSNVSDGGTFLRAGGVIDITNAGATITVNGANTFKGNISVNNNTVGLVINKNQSAAGLITMGSGSINLSAHADVTSIAFADNSGSNWNTGTINITGVSNNEVSFGTNANGLTAQQLSQITPNSFKYRPQITPKQTVQEGDPDEWVETLMINTAGPYLVSHAFVGAMAVRAPQQHL